jgi:hypothetical protein
MKKILIYTLLIFLIPEIKAQQKKALENISFYSGKTFSSFIYKDKSGNKDNNLSYTSGNTYGLSVGLNIGKKHLIRPEIVYSELGASSEFLSIPINWRLNYLGVSTGYLYKALDKKGISLSPGLIIGYDYLLKGEQLNGNTKYNLKQNDILKAWDISTGLILNNQINITKSLNVSFEYRFNIGLNQIENQDKGEKTRNISHRLLVGLSYKL